MLKPQWTLKSERIMNKALRRILTILPIAAAVILVAYLVTHRPGPAKKQVEESIRTLRVITVPAVDLIPRAIGYGVAGPGLIWEAVAEVKGTVNFVDPRLKSGQLIEAGTVLVQIDPSEYRLSVARLEAQIEETKAKRAELVEDEKNIGNLIAIESRSLELAQKTLERKVEALARNAISQDEVDREERNFLQQKQQVQQLSNSLALIPAKKKALESSLAMLRSDLEQAENDLAKTKIAAPYDCRLGEVSLDVGQFLPAGQLLFQAHGIEVAEIESRFRIEELRHLLGEEKRKRFLPGMSTGIFAQLFGDIRVFVSLQSGDWSAHWQGRVDRLRESVDSGTREMRVVAAVDDPYEKAIPGLRPPLTAGMFCRVELQAPIRAGSVVIPRSAIHNGSVFVLDRQNLLQARKVVADFVQSEFVVIKSGLLAGETIIVSDPSPAIIGMKVAPVADEELEERLIAVSQGERAE